MDEAAAGLLLSPPHYDHPKSFHILYEVKGTNDEHVQIFDQKTKVKSFSAI